MTGSSTIGLPERPDAPQDSGWRAWLHEIIFEADTPAGKAFDIGLLWCILLSVFAVMLESVSSIRADWGHALRALEWTFTILFTIEYGLRLVSVRQPWRYATSFFGIVDLLAILPTYLSLVIAGTHSLIVIRALRLLRVFRVLKLVHFVGAQRMLNAAIRASVGKITVFLGAVLASVVIVGALMYLIEGESAGFTSIPQSMYWAIVTMTTVGYGDIAPQSVAGKLLAATVMVLGYGIIAVPTGIVTVEMANVRSNDPPSTRACTACGMGGHDADARFCKHCGERMRRQS